MAVPLLITRKGDFRQCTATRKVVPNVGYVFGANVMIAAAVSGQNRIASVAEA